ncbi:hypothetical protein TNCV_3186971 [Trichonephila clavipes]|nr:hypothetical protein TNCV_3186971 [Trichonephila clavipes]
MPRKTYRVKTLLYVKSIEVPSLVEDHATGPSISNKVTLEIGSHSDSITGSIYTQKPLSVAELDKVIKEKDAPTQPIR